MPRTIHRQKVLDAVSVSQNTTAFTDAFEFNKCSGDASVLIATTAGSITVTQQVSFDKISWFDPVDDTAAALGTIAAALTVNTGRWVAYSPVLAPYARFKIVEGNVAATTVTVTTLFQEDW